METDSKSVHEAIQSQVIIFVTNTAQIIPVCIGIKFLGVHLHKSGKTADPADMITSLISNALRQFLEHLSPPVGALSFVEAPARTSVIIRCRQGRAWITQHDDTTDYLLSQGESLEFDTRRRPVISLFQDSDVEIRTAGRR
jgi:hypothetical protein